MNPAFSREQRPPPVWELTGARAEAELAGKGGEEAAGGEGAAADEGDGPADANSPTSAAQTATKRTSARAPPQKYVFSVRLKRDPTLHTGSPIALGSLAPVEVTSPTPYQTCVWVVSRGKDYRAQPSTNARLI